MHSHTALFREMSRSFQGCIACVKWALELVGRDLNTSSNFGHFFTLGDSYQKIPLQRSQTNGRKSKRRK